jgi:anti-anti-sigma factor
MTDPGFAIHSSMVDANLVVEVIGEADMATAPKLTAAFESVFDETRRVVVDLSAVGFLDSSALNALVRAQAELARREIGFRVVSPADRNVRRVFEMTRLVDALHVVDSLAEALA